MPHVQVIYINLNNMSQLFATENIPHAHRVKAPDILQWLFPFSGYECTNSGWDLKYSNVFYKKAESFKSQPYLVQPEIEDRDIRVFSPVSVSYAYRNNR